MIETWAKLNDKKEIGIRLFAVSVVLSYYWGEHGFICLSEF